MVYALVSVDAWGIEIKSYEAQDFSRLKSMKGFSDQLLQQHFTLYEGYVKNTNLLLTQIAQMAQQNQLSSPQYAELKCRFSWEFNGMRLHELYFGNLGSNGQINKEGKLYKSLEANFGSYDRWLADFKAMGGMRGIGWVVLYEDLKNGLKKADYLEAFFQNIDWHAVAGRYHAHHN